MFRSFISRVKKSPDWESTIIYHPSPYGQPEVQAHTCFFTDASPREILDADDDAAPVSEKVGVGLHQVAGLELLYMVN